MDWKNKCAALIPCFNEARLIGAVIAEVRPFFPNIIVVDDGSTDETGREAARAGAGVFRLSRNAGKGSALRAGWEHVRALGFTWVIMMDGDGQHCARDIPHFLDCAEKTGARLVVGNRMGNPAGMPWVRRGVNRWMSRRISRLTGRALPDSQCGFRLGHLETLTRLNLSARRFEIESEMLVSLIAGGHGVEFIPIRVVYGNTPSRINPLLDTWRWLRWQALQRKNAAM